MFGWIHESFRQLVSRKYGSDVWFRILQLAKFEKTTGNVIKKYYKDEETFRLVNAMATIIGIPIEEVWEAYGGFLIQYTMETGWDELLRAMSPDLQGFIEGLDTLHYFIDHVVYRTKLKGPVFRCEESDGALLLHYYSCRTGLYPIVKGVVREVARRIYNTEVAIKVQERKQNQSNQGVSEHVIFLITQLKGASDACALTSKQVATPIEFSNAFGNYPISSTDFCNIFPHHFCFDKDLKLFQVGFQMQMAYPWIVPGETLVSDILILNHPDVALSFETIISFQNSNFIFSLKDDTLTKQRAESKNAKHLSITLKGSMYLLNDKKYMCYMCSLNVTTLSELFDRNLFVSDIPLHDSTRDLIMLNQSRMSQVELNKKLEETTRNLIKMASELKVEKLRTEELLCELMPLSVAENLRQGHPVEAAEFNEATVLFTDIVTFTNICALCTPYDVVNLLNDLYLRFDKLVGLHDVYKVETIGDAYMIAGGVPFFVPDHSEKVLNVSIGMLMESKLVFSPMTQKHIRIRVGVHSGAVVAGVVGVKMPRYCLFGDTIYLANRMESNGVPGRIHVSDSSKIYALKTNSSFVFKTRGVVDMKEFGSLQTNFLEKNQKLNVWQICERKRGEGQSKDGYFELHNDISDSNNADANIKRHKNENRFINKVICNKQEVNSKTCQIL